MDQVAVPRELLRQVIDWSHADGTEYLWALQSELRTALEQPVQEPVAWRWVFQGEPDSDKCFPMPLPDQDLQDVAKMRAYPRTVQLLYAATQAQQPKVEPDNLKCKSVQKRLATLWGYVEAQQPTGWLRAIDEEMVSTHLGVADATDSYEDAKRKLNELICWHVDVSHDPKVNGKQPQLLTDELAACHKDAARYQWLVEYFVGDRTDLDDAIVGASEIGVEQVTAVIDAAMESK